MSTSWAGAANTWMKTPARGKQRLDPSIIDPNRTAGRCAAGVVVVVVQAGGGGRRPAQPSQRQQNAMNRYRRRVLRRFVEDITLLILELISHVGRRAGDHPPDDIFYMRALVLSARRWTFPGEQRNGEDVDDDTTYRNGPCHVGHTGDYACVRGVRSLSSAQPRSSMRR